MNIAILGYDTEGRSSYDYYRALGHSLTILDQDTGKVTPPDALSVLGEGYLDNLDHFDLIVRTAGLPPAKIFAANPGLDPGNVTTQINEFLRVCPTHNVIGVTGTKGKGTTSTLIHKMLIAAGFDSHLAGNIGVPALDLLAKLTETSWVVLELSSFQLSDLRSSPHIGVCLMVVPEHLNWHTDVADYYAAKAHLFARQTANDIAIFYNDNDQSRAIASVGSGQKIPFFTPPGAIVVNGNIVIDDTVICATNELQLLGDHNWQNVCAAVTAVWQVTHNVTALRSVLTTFSGLPHRLELIRHLRDVAYYDDSFGTTPETAIVAVQAFSQPKVIILGGSDKGADYTQLAQVIGQSQIRQVLLIGEQAARIQSALIQADVKNFASGGKTMAAVVQTAHNLAMPGDVVLLSTGCASFDMFHDYKDRAAQFTSAVLALT